MLLASDGSRYARAEYRSEAHLEETIESLERELFGANRVYLPVKRRIGAKGKKANIPDGYVLDLNGENPRLYVVENELASHDPLKHIAVQILEFSLTFEADGRRVKSVLLEAIRESEHNAFVSEYVASGRFRSLDHLLDYLVFDTPFSALVVIDRVPEDLDLILQRKFQFGVEILELGRFVSDDGREVYQFEPFLADVSADVGPGETSAIDTIVVPARSDGAVEVFLGEDRWYQIRMHSSMRPQIRHIAMYQTKPVSAITHIADVASIEPWKETNKYVVSFVGPAKPIGPIKLVKRGRAKAPQAPRYTTRSKLLAARTLDDVW